MERYRRAWGYIASISFVSEEGFAAHCHTGAAFNALRQSPLMPVRPSQREKMGDARAEECITPQTSARGSDAPMLPASKKPPFPSWTPSAYNDGSLSADLWSRFACFDSNAGSISCGNHLCMPRVCFKGRWARLGFCRMIFWHWRACVSAKGKAVAKRAHGHLLQPRWDQEVFPPIITSPSQAGLPTHIISK